MKIESAIRWSLLFSVESLAFSEIPKVPLPVTPLASVPILRDGFERPHRQLGVCTYTKYLTSYEKNIA